MAKDNVKPEDQFDEELADDGTGIEPCILTPKIVQDAVSLAFSGIVETMKHGYTNRKDLCIVVRDHTGAIIYETPLGEDWEFPYQRYARGKSYAAWRENMPTRQIQFCEPFRTRVGDPVYVGGVPIPGRLGAVGCSGVQDYFDEMFGNWIVAAIVALCHQKMVVELRATKDPPNDFHK